MRQAILDVARFWLDRGVDGFRLDAMHTVNADLPPYRDNPVNPNSRPGPLWQDQQPFFRQLHDEAQLNQPAIQQLSTALRALTDEYEDRFLVGEVDGDNDNGAAVSETFTTTGRLHATYNFDLLAWEGLTVADMKDILSKATGRFNGSGRLSFAFSNHDVPRSATRYLAPLGIEASRQTELQLLLLKLEASLIGSCCVYQGEELACEDVRDIPHDRMRDPWGIEFAPTFLGRDTCRTPMVWDSALPNGGFSVANSTWLPVSDRHLDRAGLDEVARPGSLYNDFSAFLTWRKSQPAMMEANRMSEISGGPDQIVFDRISDRQRLRCSFDFKALTAEFEDIAIDEGAGTA